MKEMYELEPGCRAALNARTVAPAPVGEGLSRESGRERGRAIGRQAIGEAAGLQRPRPCAAFSLLGSGGHGGSDGVLPLAVRATSRGGHAGRHPGAAQVTSGPGIPRDGADLNFATPAQCDGGGTTSAKTTGLHPQSAADDAGLPPGPLKLEAPRPGKDKLPEERQSAR